MAFYTLLVKDVCEQYAGQSGPYSTVIPMAQSKVFDFTYPVPTGGVSKDDFEQGFLKHFYLREIGMETIDYWKLKLDDRLNTIMPYYNKMLTALAEEYDFLNPTEYSENIESTDTTHSQENGTDNVTNTSSSESSANSQMTDTPQSDLTDFNDNQYMTSASKSSGTTSGNSSDERTTNKTVDGNKSGNVTRTIKGRNGYDGSTLLKNYIDAQRNIIQEIYNACDNLFMLVWDFEAY